MNAPIHLYRFRRGATDYRFTSWPVNVSTVNSDAGTESWTALDIAHGEIESTLEFLPEGFDVSVRTDDPDSPFRYWTERFALEKTLMALWRSDADDLTYHVTDDFLYSGEVESVEYEENGVIRLRIGSIFNVGRQQALRVMVSRFDNMPVTTPYGGVSEASITTAGTVSAFSASPALPSVTASAWATKAAAESDPNWFALGKVTFGAQVRLCTGQSGGTLYLNAPFLGLELGSSVSAVAGYDRRIATRESKFSDGERFIGFPYLPNRSPQFEALTIPAQKGGKK